MLDSISVCRTRNPEYIYTVRMYTINKVPESLTY
jgi:hypothetical protein